MPTKTTIHFKGAKDVIVKTTGNESNGVTVGLTCAADGSKLPPLVIFKGKRNGTNSKKIPREVKESGVDDVYVCFQEKSFMNEDVMLNEFLSDEYTRHFDLNNSLLVMDSLKAHRTDKVKDRLKELGVRHSIIPGGYTSKLQPLDVGIIKPFKDKLREYWAHWMRGDSPMKKKKPSYAVMCKWVSDAWKSIDRRVIANSFRKAFTQHKQ